MADNRRKVGSPDSKTINLSEPYEVKYWANKFGVTQTALKQAVKDHGKSAAKVRAALKGKS